MCGKKVWGGSDVEVPWGVEELLRGRRVGW